MRKSGIPIRDPGFYVDQQRVSKIKLRIALLLTSIFLSVSSYAMKPLVILSGGLANSLGRDSQSFIFANTTFNYQPRSSSVVKSMVGGFIGVEESFREIWAWQFGLAYYQGVSSSVSGEEIQAPIESPEAVNQWHYQYKISSRQVLLESKLSLVMKQRYRPYLLIGLGEGLNHAYAFQVTPENSGEIATAVFSENLNKKFIYTIGLGLDMDIFRNARIGIGYRYIYLGKYDLGRGVIDTGAGGSVFDLPALKSMHVNNNEILIQFTYLFQGAITHA